MRRGGLFSWIIGIVAGTFVGILFAPKKGTQLRKNIKKEREKGGWGWESVKKAYKDLGEELVETAHHAYESDEVQDVVKEAKKTAGELKNKAKDKIDEFGQYIEQEGAEQAEKVVKKANKFKRKAGKVVKKAQKKAEKNVKKTIKKIKGKKK